MPRRFRPKRSAAGWMACCGSAASSSPASSTASITTSGIPADRSAPGRRNYDVSNWQAGKAACKAALQRELGLPEAPRTPLIAQVGRLADQKGWDLVLDVMRRWATEMDVQWAILGTGEPYLSRSARAAEPRSFRNRVAARLEFSDPLAHRIEAGADIFLMPSRYEPCGLNQLYSLKYGTVPVVRATGGLVDTVTDTTPETLAKRHGDRLFVRGPERQRTGGDAAPGGRDLLAKRGHLATTGRDGNAAGLVVEGQRPAVRRSLCQRLPPASARSASG